MIGSHCDCNLAAVPEKMFGDHFHILYMVRLEVVCVLFNRVSAWMDSILLDSLQYSVEKYKSEKKNCLFQSDVFPINVAIVSPWIVLTWHLPPPQERFREMMYKQLG